jgi:transcriptional regulator with PAS, ATPase and Fis domain
MNFSQIYGHGSLKEMLKNVEVKIIQSVLNESENLSQAARFLGLKRTTLIMRLKRLGLESGMKKGRPKKREEI